MSKCADKVIDPEPIIKELADQCLGAKGLECSILGDVIDRLRSAPAVHNAPYWATEAAYKNGYEAGKRDAVPVVRCKDCKRWHKDTFSCDFMKYGTHVYQPNWYEEDFCSYGERKANETV